MVHEILMSCSDAEDTLYVYHWREEQEAAMRAAKGTGMTPEQVVNFVNGCKSSGPSALVPILMPS